MGRHSRSVRWELPGRGSDGRRLGVDMCCLSDIRLCHQDAPGRRDDALSWKSIWTLVACYLFHVAVSSGHFAGIIIILIQVGLGEPCQICKYQVRGTHVEAISARPDVFPLKYCLSRRTW